MARKLTYKTAGVDIDRANEFVKKIRPLVESTYGQGALGAIGGFAGFFKADFSGMKEPVLASAADGVGTKSLAAAIAGRYGAVGIDLVAMCVNDIITCGARPLFFLDYLAAGKLKTGSAVDIIKGVATGCKEAGCALLGGETAEMPGLYKKDDFDLAGFCVGVVDKARLIDGSKVKAGDRIIGLASSGVHSNGYSLVRKLFSPSEIKNKYKRRLLRPTAIYVKPVLELIKDVAVKALAHITGGGFYDNIPRALPDGTAASVDKSSWEKPPVFEIIRKRSALTDKELYRTFNMGIGMTAIVDKEQAKQALKKLKDLGIRSWDIGEVINWAKKEVIL